MKRTLSLALALAMACAVVGWTEVPAGGRVAYVGASPYSLVAFLPAPIAATASGLGILTGQEAGLALYGGLPIGRGHDLELRLSTGSASPIDWEVQAQFGYLWYPGESFADWDGGLAIGLFIRNFAWWNSVNGHWLVNHVPKLAVGWRLWLGDVALDLRGGWNILGLSWTPDGRAAVGACLTDFPTNLDLTFGIAWGFRD